MFKMATEVYNWVQKYDANLDNRQVSDEKKKLGHMHGKHVSC